ncbi:drebrin-like isoform X1 [Chiloscyllium plagiosum]|uniref:drebrin-like isoform X1 n=1 Tax=Chiloscyllium plagiosum TaxID=36176 RepID=UPI001CB87D1E|nr:drebrin-like isoform X1 [Chiloscyllium plagiosum]
MALNLSIHRLALLTAYEDVINEKTSTDWALYTYEDNTDNLKLADSGAGGLQEIATKFDNQSVMYGFCSIKDSGSGLPKYVLINWVGEDVDDIRKCTCASHVPTIADFFQGANVIVNASSPEDVDSTAIRQKLTNGTMHISSPVLRRLHLKEDDDLLGPVGTTYQKTNAAIEMKRINRELFWAQAKREEELRKEEERKKLIEEREKFEKERMEQEKKEQENREQRYREREKQIEEERKKLQNLEVDEIKSPSKQNNTWDVQREGMEENEDEENKGSKISDSAEKAAEAAALIALRDGNPREFFKQRERAMTTSFETVPFSGQRPGRVSSPFLKNQHSLPERSWSPPRSPCPRIAANHNPLQSCPSSHQTQIEMTRVEDVTSFSAPESGIVATPIYEENEEAEVEELSNRFRFTDKTVLEFPEEPPIQYGNPVPEWNVPSYSEEPGLVDIDTPNPVWPEAPNFLHTEDSVQSEQAGFISTGEQPQQQQQQHLVDIGSQETNESFPQVNENLLDLWEANGIDQLPSMSHSELAEKPLVYTSTEETELILNVQSPPLDKTVSTNADIEANSQLLVNFQESSAEQAAELEPAELDQQQAPSCGEAAEENLLCFDGNEGLPAPPPDCLDSQQWENLPSLIELEGSQQMSEDYCFGIQELPKPQDAQAVQDFFNQSQDEYIKVQTYVEDNANKIPEIDITYCDNDTDTDPDHSPAD